MSFQKATRGIRPVKVLLSGPAGGGKAQPLTSKILTSEGWKKMGDIQTGENVFNSEGKISTVLGVFPQGLKDVYELQFQDKTTVKCCDEHLWLTQDTNERRKNIWTVKTTAQIQKSLKKNGRNNHFIPIVQPINFEEKEYLIHPYVMGCVLGDGSISTDKGGIVLTNIDKELLDKVSSFLPDTFELRPYTSKEFGIVNKKEFSGKGNAISRYFESSGLRGCRSDEKFIPLEYLHGSVKDRIHLLQGLVDTDGSIFENKGYAEYTTVSEKLKNDVVFLVQSLGGIVVVSTRIPTYTYKGEKRHGKLSYRLKIRLPNNIESASLSRKVEKRRYYTKYGIYRNIKSITYIGKEICQCIQVDSPDSLYITDNFVLTHNTKSALRLMKGFIGDKPLLVVDTENNSSTIYANEFDFLIHNMEEKDQTIKGYIEVMDKAKAEGTIRGVILDGITPAWKYILDLSNKMEGNTYLNWSKLTPLYDNLKKAIVNYPIPLICTVRSKQDYVLELNDKGKQVPKKVGLAMEAGKDIDFDFDIVFAIDQTTNMARIDKCRYSEVVEYFKDKGGEVLLTEEVGTIIKKAIKGE